MYWFAIRCIYHFGIKSNGINVFEERIVCFKAKTVDEAHEKADKESLEYASAHGFIVHSQQDGYMQDGDQLIDGYELWSTLYESHENLNDFYNNRYVKFQYSPDENIAKPGLKNQLHKKAD